MFLEMSDAMYQNNGHHKTLSVKLLHILACQMPNMSSSSNAVSLRSMPFVVMSHLCTIKITDMNRTLVLMITVDVNGTGHVKGRGHR